MRRNTDWAGILLLLVALFLVVWGGFTGHYPPMFVGVLVTLLGTSLFLELRK